MTRTAVSLLARPFLARPFLALALAGVLAAPLLAETAGDASLIDLTPVLEAPDALDAGAGPASDTGRNTGPARPAEIVSDAALTLPRYDRSGGVAEGGAGALPGDVLLPLHPEHPTLDGIVRLTGEVQSERFFVDLPIAGAARDVVLSYRIAINVLPDQSELLIRVNGTNLAPIHPDAFEGFEQVVLPGALLDAGRNEITVTVHHAHRIFCGPDATFAVWTEIDTDTSGVRLARADLPTDSSGLVMALRAQLALSGNMPVRLANPEDDALLVALTPRLAGLRDGAPVVLTPQSPYGVSEGAPQMARITVLPGTAPRAEVRRAADGALVLVVMVGPDGTPPDLDDLLPLPAPVPNIAALAPGPATTLRDLGFTQTEAFNRYSEQEITFGLPRDWLILASQKALLRLVYSFAGGLPEGALMLVKINGTTVRLLPLDREGGKVLPTLDIDFPARLLVPGANALTFVAIVPGDPPDMPCPPTSGPLMTIGAQSTLMVPPSPRMHMAGLAAPLVALRPDQVTPVSGDPSEAPTGDLLSALASALRPIAGTGRLEAASLTVTNGPGTERLNLEDLEISRRDLLRLFPVERPAPASGQVTPDAAPPEPERPGLLARARTMVTGTVTRFTRLAVPGDGALAPWLEGRQAEAMLFIPDDDAPEALWLMVRPETEPRRVAAILAQARLTAHGPRGRFSILTPKGTWESWHTTRTAPVLDEPLTMANFRHVAGNYASWSPLYFCAALLALTLVSACLALVFIVTTRGKRKR